MKKITLLVIILMAGSAQASQGALLDTYFGVNLTVNNANEFNMPWDPVTGFMMQDNWAGSGNDNAPDPGSNYPISEVFDMEALYMGFDLNNNQLVYSIVTSMPSTGYDQVAWYPGYVFRPGDIKFNVGADQYVVSTFGGQYAGYNYSAGGLYLNPDMGYYEGHRGFGSRGNPVMANYNQNGSMVSASSGFYFNYANYGLMENGFDTYLIEGRIDFSDLGGLNMLQNGVSMEFAMSCNNDMGMLTGAPPEVVPEPATIFLMGFGLMGLYGSRRFRK